MSTTTTTTKRGTTTTAPMVPEQRAPLANVTEAINERAAINALPPQFPLIVAAPPKPQLNEIPTWAVNATFFIAAGLASAVFWTVQLALWTLLHALMWVNGLALRLIVAVIAVAMVAHYAL